MNPHRMTWGMMYDMPVAMIIGIATLVGWVLTNQDRRIPVNAVTVLMFLLLFWTSLTTLTVVEEPEGIYQWKQFFKTLVMTFVALSLMKEKLHFRYLVWITVLSIGYFSFKGGIFTLVTGGGFLVWGPPNTAIEDNNALALATLMIIPLMIYLAQTTENRWAAYGLYAAALFSLISVVGSYSRGGFLGLAAIAILLWVRAKRKAVIGIAVGAALTVGLAAVPTNWVDRMNTIQNYGEDASAVGRLEQWGHAIRIANESPILGGGFGIFGNTSTYQRLSPEITVQRNVHSIYFEMLATQGYVGLVIFLLMGFAGLLTARKIKLLTRHIPGFENERKFANMIQISLLAYAVSGTFQNLSTYDMYYTLLALIAIQYWQVTEALKKNSVVEKSAEPPSGIAVADQIMRPTQMPGRSFLRTPTS